MTNPPRTTIHRRATQASPARTSARRLRTLAASGAALAFLLAACTATQATGTSQPDTPGFWLGLWHGFIAPITFLVSLFSDTVRLYAVPNVGRWYDFGFMLGIGGFSGGIFAGSRRRRR